MAHTHHAGGMLMLDTLAAHSGLLGVSPAIKTGFSIIALVTCVAASDAVVGLFVALSMILIMRFPGKTSFSRILALLRIPMLFLTVSCLVILLEISGNPMGIRQRRCHVPELVIELMYLIYRYLFVLLDVQRKLTTAASARLGYRGLRNSVCTAGRISGALLASSFRRSNQCFDAMESRGYDGKLRFLSHTPAFQWQHLLTAAAYLLVLFIFVLFRKRVLCL